MTRGFLSPVALRMADSCFQDPGDEGQPAINLGVIHSPSTIALGFGHSPLIL